MMRSPPEVTTRWPTPFFDCPDDLIRRVQPICLAITVAGVVGVLFNNAWISDSTASTAEPAGFRS